MKISIIGINDHSIQMANRLSAEYPIYLFSLEQTVQNIHYIEEFKNTRIDYTSNFAKVFSSEVIIVNLDDASKSSSLQDIYLVMDYIKEHNSGSPLVIFTHVLNIGDVKTVKSYCSKNHIKVRLAYVPYIIGTNNILIGSNAENEAILIKTIFNVFDLPFITSSPETVEVATLALAAKKIIDNAYVFKIKSLSKKFNISSKKLFEILNIKEEYTFTDLKSSIKLLNSANGLADDEFSLLSSALKTNKKQILGSFYDFRMKHASLSKHPVAIISTSHALAKKTIKKLLKEDAIIHLYVNSSVVKIYESENIIVHSSIAHCVQNVREVIVVGKMILSPSLFIDKSVYDKFDNFTPKESKQFTLIS